MRTLFFGTLALLGSFAITPLANALEGLPSQFSNQSAAVQAHICGDLLASMALAGVRDSASKLDESPESLALAYETGAHAILALERSASLSAEDKGTAIEAAKEIEAMAAMPHIRTVVYCRNTIQSWIDSGEVIPEAFEQALTQSQAMLPQLVGPDSLLM